MMSDEVDLVAYLPENTPDTDTIQNQIKSDHIPSSGDGISNAWRTYYICEVFDCQDVNLNQIFPFKAMTTAKRQGEGPRLDPPRQAAVPVQRSLPLPRDRR
jgi:hypothetical protein